MNSRLVLDYRPYPSDRGKRLNEGDFVGLGVIFGKKDGNYWVEYGGRPYLCATEHLRGLSPEEEALEAPHLRQRLDEIRKIAEQEEYDDLTGINPDEGELAQVVQRLDEAQDLQATGDAEDDLLQDDGVPAGSAPAASADDTRPEGGGSEFSPNQETSLSESSEQRSQALPIELQQYVNKNGWMHDEHGRLLLITMEAWARRTPHSKYGDRWLLRTTWEYRFGQ